MAIGVVVAIAQAATAEAAATVEEGAIAAAAIKRPPQPQGRINLICRNTHLLRAC